MKPYDELREELARIGPETFRRKYGPMSPTGLRHEGLPAVRAILAELDRDEAVGHRAAEAGRGAQLVGHADDANRIARQANFLSWAALIVSVGALIASLIALRR